MNPILKDFREQAKHTRWPLDDLHDSFLDWLDHTDESNLYSRENGLTNRHIDHAHSVLVRLYNVDWEAWRS